METKSRFLSVLLCVFLVLGIFVRNIEVIVQFQYYLFFISAVFFIYSFRRFYLKVLTLVGGVFFLFICYVLKNIFESNGYSDSLIFGFYYIIMIFSIYIIMHILIINQYMDFRLLVRLFIMLNLIGLLSYLLVFLIYNYSEVVTYWRYNVISRADILNDIRSFVYGDEMYPRYNGFYIDPNRWAFCILIQLIISDYLFFNTRTITRKIKNILFVILILSMILTSSRAGIASFILYYILTRSKAKALGIVIILSFSICCYLLYNPELAELIYYKITYGVNLTPSISNIAESRARIDIWYNYVQYIFSDWFTLLVGVNMILDPSDIMNITPHNLYIYSLYQGGLVLLSIVICFLAVLYYKSSKLSKYLKYGTLAMIIMTFTEDYAALPIFWFYAFFIILLYRVIKTNRGDVFGTMS